MNNKYLAYGGFAIIGVLLIAGIVFSYTGSSGVSGFVAAADGYTYPTNVQEPNNNKATILPQIQADDNVWNSNWVVCGPTYLGGTPMSVLFPVDAGSSAELSFESKVAGKDARMDVFCRNPLDGSNVYLKQNWIPTNRVNALSIPSKCLSSNLLNVSWKRLGVNCLKFDYIRVKYQPVAPAVCGNGVKEGAEACDDGNQVAGDGCENDCTATLVVATCADSDNGKNYDVKGTISGQNVTNGVAVPYLLTDSCSGGNWLIEYSCEDAVKTYAATNTDYKYNAVWYDCAGAGKICKDGAC